MNSQRELWDTQLDWLGRIPADWELKRLGTVFKERNQTVSDTDFPPLSVTMQGIVPQMDHVAKTMNNDSRKLVRAGDFVINSRSDRKGSGGVSDRDGSVSVISMVMEPRGISPRYVHHLLRSPAFQEEFYRWGSGIVADLWSTRYQAMSRIQIPVPPRREQEQIAEYLDCQTAKIDMLIDKQRQLISGLDVRRWSLLARGVTGAKHDGQKKASGLSWASEIPAHWTVGNIRRFADMKTGHTPSRSVPEYWVDATIPWVTLADVWQLRDGRLAYIEKTTGNISELGLRNSAAELLPAGTVVLSRTASVGFAGIMPEPMATSQDYWNWVCGPKLLPKFLMYVFRAMREEFKALSTGSTHKTIYQGDAASFRIPVPPLDEQREIVDHLDRQIARIHTLIDKSQRLIELSQERRAALITAAVTGQIDVREREFGKEAA